MKNCLNKAVVSAYLFVLLFPLLVINCGKSDKGGRVMELAKLIPDQIRNWNTVGDIERYDRQTIFDYIDGAGEVYLLYGFKDVVVKKLQGPDAVEIVVELFDMGKSEDAFGIFSHSREGDGIGIGAGSEYRDGFLCFWKSRYFVCIYSDRPSEEINGIIKGIGGEIDKRISGDSRKPGILNVLPDEGLAESSVIYFHKQTSLNYHYFLSEENILNLNDRSEAVLANYGPERMTLLCINYPDSNIAIESYNNFMTKYIPESAGSGLAQTEKGKWVKALVFNDFFVAVFDAPDENIASTLADKVKEKISRIGNGQGI